MPIDACGKNLFDGGLAVSVPYNMRKIESEIEKEILKGESYQEITTFSLSSATDDLKVYFKSEDLKEGDDNMKNILDIYQERKKEAIEEKYARLIKEIKEEDPIQKIMEETNRLIQDTDPSKKFPKVIYYNYTDETKEDIDDMEKARKIEIKELENLIEEIEAYFTMTTDFSERKEILKNYGIVDKKGKLII